MEAIARAARNQEFIISAKASLLLSPYLETLARHSVVAILPPDGTSVFPAFADPREIETNMDLGQEISNLFTLADHIATQNEKYQTSESAVLSSSV